MFIKKFFHSLYTDCIYSFEKNGGEKMFHKNLRNARESCDLSQKELAEMLKIPVTTYRNYENTLREPSFELLKNLSEILNVSVDRLLGIESEDEKYLDLFAKIKQLDENKLYTLTAFTDFLYSRK